MSVDFDRLNALWNLGTRESLRAFYWRLFDLADLISFAEWRRWRSEHVSVPVELEGRGKVACVMLSVEPTRVPLGDIRVNVFGRDRFFNESRWFNEGIERALREGAEWVVVMSDDLTEVSPFGSLPPMLADLDADVVWVDPRPDFYHSYPAYFARKHPLESRMGSGHSELDALHRMFEIETFVASETPIRKPLHYYLFNRMFPRPRAGPSFKMTSDFFILSAAWCERHGPEVLDERFLGWEDMDLSLRVRNAPAATVPFRIGSEIGRHYAPGMAKALKEVYNLALFNRFLKDGRYA